MQTGLQDEEDAGAEQQAAGADGGIFHDDFLRRVEAAELAREFVKISAEKVGPQLRGGELEGNGEGRELAG